MFDKGTFNSVKFKVIDNEGEEKVNNKINEVKKDLEKKNCKILIEKKEKQDFKKRMKNFVTNVTNPRRKVGIMNENIGAENNDKNKFKIMPNKIRNKHSFSNEFKNINYKYKQFKEDK